MMKVILLNPATNGPYNYPHIGIAFLSSILRKAGYDVRCFDGSAPYRPPRNDDLVKECVEFNPNVICVTATTERVKFAYNLLCLLKNTLSNVPVIVGGPHATIRPVEMVAHGFDVAVIGAAEKRIVDLVEAIGSKDTESLKKISGMAYNNAEGGIRLNPPDDTEDDFDIDSLLPVDFSCFREEDYLRKDSDKYRYSALFVGRGCPGQCFYCDRSVFGRKLTTASPDRIIADMIARHNKYKIDNFIKPARKPQAFKPGDEWRPERSVGNPAKPGSPKETLDFSPGSFIFLDDTLLWNKKVISALCDKISSTRELSGITWGCNARPNLTDEELLLKMKHAGCNLIILGVESGDAETLERIKKGIKRETMVSCIDAILVVGIKVTVNLMNGFPWQTMDTVRTQMTFVDALKKRGVSAISAGSTVFPYPGTKLFTEYCGRGYNLYNWWLRDDLFEKNNVSSLRDRLKQPYYYKYLPSEIKIKDSEDFFRVYKDQRMKKATEALLNDIQEYNLNNSAARLLKHGKVRQMVRFVGNVLYRLSPMVEEWFWKKVV